MDKFVIDTSQISEHYKRCKDSILSYCKEGDAFRALIGNHNHWWHTDRQRGTAKLFYPNDQDYDILASKHRTLYWTAQLFSATTAKIEQPYDFKNHKISKQIGSREDTVYHSFFLDLDKAKTKSIEDPGVTEWLEKAIKFFADTLLAAGINSFGLAFSGGGVYCVLHPRLGMIDESLSDRAYKIEIIQKAFDLFIGDVAAEFFSSYPEAVHWVKFDKLNYDNKRQVKTLLSIHKKYPYVVAPLDKHNPKINLEDASLPISDQIIERAKSWLSYQGDMDSFGKMLSPWLKKAKSSIQKTPGKRTVNLETAEVPESEWSPCMRNLLGKMNLKSGEGATRALAVLASYMRYAGVPEEKAFSIFQRKANEWNAETSNIFESWFGCEHLDKPICFVPSCEKIQARGSGYPHPELGELEVCTPDVRCKNVRSPIEYHVRNVDKLQDVGYYLKYRERKDGTSEVTGIEDKLFADDLTDIHHFKTLRDTDEVLYYEHGYYHYEGEAVVRAESERVFGKHLNTYRSNEILNHVRRSTQIKRKKLNNDPWILNLENGVFNIKKFEFASHSPNVLSTIRLPVKYDPNATSSEIENFISSIVYPEHVQLIKEMIGYCLYHKYTYQNWFLLHGDGENGKSSLLSLIAKFLGEDNVSSVGLQDLNRRFGPVILYGKSANIVADLSDADLTQTSRLKQLTGGDLIAAEPKFKNAFTYLNFAKLIYSCNKVPLTEDKSRAFFRRVIFIPFPNTFFAGLNADENLLEKLTSKTELSGLFNIAVDALKRVIKNRGFSSGLTPEETEELYERASNPVFRFFNDWCQIDIESFISKQELYNSYCEYCKETKVIAFSERKFIDQMRLLTKMEDAQRGGIGHQKRVWLGITTNHTHTDKQHKHHKHLISSPKAMVKDNMVKDNMVKDNMVHGTLGKANGAYSAYGDYGNIASCEICGKTAPLTSYNLNGKDIGICGECLSELLNKQGSNHFSCVCGKKFDTIKVLRHHQANCKEFQAAQDNEAREHLQKEASNDQPLAQ